MQIFIKELRVNNIHINRVKDEDEISGEYSLISNVNKVLSTDDFNGYGKIKVNFSPKTIDTLKSFLASITEDISITVLGEIQKEE